MRDIPPPPPSAREREHASLDFSLPSLVIFPVWYQLTSGARATVTRTRGLGVAGGAGGLPCCMLVAQRKSEIKSGRGVFEGDEQGLSGNVGGFPVCTESLASPFFLLATGYRASFFVRTLPRCCWIENLQVGASLQPKTIECTSEAAHALRRRAGGCSRSPDTCRTLRHRSPRQAGEVLHGGGPGGPWGRGGCRTRAEWSSCFWIYIYNGQRKNKLVSLFLSPRHVWNYARSCTHPRRLAG